MHMNVWQIITRYSRWFWRGVSGNLVLGILVLAVVHRSRYRGCLVAMELVERWRLYYRVEQHYTPQRWLCSRWCIGFRLCFLEIMGGRTASERG